MFERYTERARRVIFFARYEASQFGQPYIESEHLLLGVAREARGLMVRVLGSADEVEQLRTLVLERTNARNPFSTSVDLPLSNECKRILAYSAEEAERLNHRVIEVVHLLLGIMRERGCMAEQILADRGLELESLREAFRNEQVPLHEEAETGREGSASLDNGQGHHLEILNGDVRLALVDLTITDVVPRIGEHIQVRDSEFVERKYRVLDVVYRVESMSPGIRKTPKHLAKITKIIVQVEGS